MTAPSICAVNFNGYNTGMNSHPYFRRPLEIRCSLCGETIPRHDGDIVSFDRFIFDEKHPLYASNASAMHRRCFSEWEHRRLFVRLFNDYQNSVDGSQHMRQNGKVDDLEQVEYQGKTT
jgi:hypothetical protein